MQAVARLASYKLFLNKLYKTTLQFLLEINKVIKMSSMVPPCEAAVKEILPSIRSLLAEKLIKEKKVSIYKASMLMGLTPAAVENYLKGKRGTAVRKIIEQDTMFISLLNEISEKLIKEENPNNIASYYCILCSESKKILNRHGYKFGVCMYELRVDSLR